MSEPKRERARISESIGRSSCFLESGADRSCPSSLFAEKSLFFVSFIFKPPVLWHKGGQRASKQCYERKDGNDLVFAPSALLEMVMDGGHQEKPFPRAFIVEYL